MNLAGKDDEEPEEGDDGEQELRNLSDLDGDYDYSDDDGVPAIKEYRINDFITLKLKQNRTNIYIGGLKFRQCKMIITSNNVPVGGIPEGAKSIDEKYPNSHDGLVRISIDISSLALKSLPDWIQEFFDLVHICIQKSQVSTLPPSIINLKKLQVLAIPDNKFETIPDHVKYLMELEDIFIQGNPIRVIQDWIFEMPKLLRLHISQSLPINEQLPIKRRDLRIIRYPDD